MRGTRPTASVGMNQDVENTTVEHDPWDGIRPSSQGHKEGKLRRDKWLRRWKRLTSRLWVYAEGAEIRRICPDAFFALRDVEVLHEGRTEHRRILGVVRVIGCRIGWIGIGSIIRKEHDVYVVALGGPGSRNARAILSPRRLHVCVCQCEKREESRNHRSRNHRCSSDCADGGGRAPHNPRRPTPRLCPWRDRPRTWTAP